MFNSFPQPNFFKCCHNCVNRKFGCQNINTCNEYKQAKENLAEYHEKHRQEKDFNNAVAEAAERTRKRSKRKNEKRRKTFSE